jgi:hypothetical protein
VNSLSPHAKKLKKKNYLEDYLPKQVVPGLLDAPPPADGSSSFLTLCMALKAKRTEFI